MKSTITHPSLGEITVSQTWRARRISLSVRPPGRIRLSLPYNMPLSEALKFVDAKEAWVRKALERLAARRPVEVIAMPYSTRRHHLRFEPCDTTCIRAIISEESIRICYPLRYSYTDPEVQSAAKKGIEEAWRLEAKEILPIRVKELATQWGFHYGKVSIRNTVSKWGSCSSRNDLSLSLHLMRLPDHLIDYVLIHELCHTVHKNHGPKFHALLDRCTGGHDNLYHRELRTYGTRW